MSMQIFFRTALLLLSSCYAIAQTPGATPKQQPVSPLAQYAGTWSSAFGGHVWLELRLELQGDQLQGSLVHARNIEIADTGDLKSISEERSTEIITDAVVNPDGLVLTVKDSETQESERYLMRLVSSTRGIAELKMVGMPVPPGIPKPKPWRLMRSGGGSAQPGQGPN